ncbi:MAG: hypothetical protein AB1468_06850 [Candidatus Micrarchaeota archaeon]
MAGYSVDFAAGWDEHFKDFDKAVQLRIMKKIFQLQQPLGSRHLKHGLPYFVEEIAGYRIIFKIFEDRKLKRIEFVGNHKQYEKWCLGK